MSRTKTARTLLAALILAAGVGIGDAAAQQSRLVGRWQCMGAAQNGLVLVSSFDYRADGTYVSTQRISMGNELIVGGGSGRWRMEGDTTLFDTKEVARLDRYVRDGLNVTQSDPQWAVLNAQAQSRVGLTDTGQVQFIGDQTVVAAGLVCHREQ